MNIFLRSINTLVFNHGFCFQFFDILDTFLFCIILSLNKLEKKVTNIESWDRETWLPVRLNTNHTYLRKGIVGSCKDVQSI